MVNRGVVLELFTGLSSHFLMQLGSISLNAKCQWDWLKTASVYHVSDDAKKNADNGEGKDQTAHLRHRK